MITYITELPDAPKGSQDSPKDCLRLTSMAPRWAKMASECIQISSQICCNSTPPGSSWLLLLAPPGSSRLPLAPPASSWLPLPPPGSSWHQGGSKITPATAYCFCSKDGLRWLAVALQLRRNGGSKGYRHLKCPSQKHFF